MQLVINHILEEPPDFSNRGFMNTNKISKKLNQLPHVLHRNKEKYNFDQKRAKIIKHIPYKKKRLAIEFAVILLNERIVQRSGKFKLSPTLAQFIITEHNLC